MSSRRRVRGLTIAVVLSLSLFVTSALTVAGAAPIAASGQELPPDLDISTILPAAGVKRITDATVRADSLRSAFNHGSYLSSVLAVEEFAPKTTLELPSPTARQRSKVVGLPAPLREPVAGILAAVVRATKIVGDVPWGRIANALAEEDARMRREVRKTQTLIPSPPKHPTVGHLIRYHEDERKFFEREPVGTSHEGVAFSSAMRGRSQLASAVIANALDYYLPAIRSFSGSFNRGRSVAACDGTDAAPLLCVGSNGDNVHDKNAMLLIDTGGNDLYKNSAGASFMQSNAAPVSVSVNVDVAGNDKYTTDPALTLFVDPLSATGNNNVAVFAQGASLSGVGMLVDEIGDDAYIVTPPKLDQSFPLGRMFAQGASKYGGSGFLFDGSGSDTYKVEGWDGPESTNTFAQAYAGRESTAALVDSAAGNDVYSLDTGTSTHVIDAHEPYSLDQIYGQAHASEASTAVLFDDGGTDHFTISGRTHFIPTIDDYSRVNEPWVLINGQAHSQGGEAFLLEGAGNTTYTMELAAEGLASLQINGQAWQALPPVAFLQDLGGNDNYRASARTNYERAFVHKDDCLCEAAEVVIDSLGQGSVGSVAAQAQGGLMEDRAGDDRYQIETVNNYSFTLKDRLTKPLYPPLMRLFSGHGRVQGQGRQADAFLIDRGLGTDRYSTIGEMNLDSRVSSRNWKKGFDVRTITSPVITEGQGLGGTALGAVPLVLGIIDEGGDRDEFILSSTANGVSVPNPWSSYEFGLNLWPKGQGGYLYAGGIDPLIIRTSSATACGDPGYHGFGRWDVCTSAAPEDPDHDPMWPPAGFGYAPLSTGALPKLEILPGTPPSIPSDPRGLTRLPISARLLGPNGAPLVGVPVHFDLMFTLKVTGQLPTQDVVPPLGRLSAYQETAITNEQGIATSRLPLLIALRAGDDLVPDAELIFSALATFDGGRGLYPAHATQPIELLPPGPGVARSPRYAE